MAKTYYILDSNAVVAVPDILSRVRSQNLLIPQSVLEELLGRKRRTGMHPDSLLEQALAKGLQIPKGPKADSDILMEMTRAGLAGADIELAMLAEEYATRHGNHSVVVVTLDKLLSRWLSGHGVQSMTPQEFSLRTKHDSPDPEVRRTARHYTRKQSALFVGGVLCGVAVAVAYNYRYELLALLPAQVPTTRTCGDGEGVVRGPRDGRRT